MDTTFPIFSTCDVEFAEPVSQVCPICADERQYLPADGVPNWTTVKELHEGRSNNIFEIEPGLHGIVTEPEVGIGQRRILVQTTEVNLLWDPIGWIDDATIEALPSPCGSRWNAARYPHMYGAQSAWREAFDGTEILICARDADWVQRPSKAMYTWGGTHERAPGITLHRLGGHFAGSGVVHSIGANSQGVLLTGDTIFPVPAAGWVTFMRS